MVTHHLVLENSTCVEDAVSRSQTNFIVNLAITALSERDKYVVEESYFNDRSNSEIATELNVSKEMVFKIKKRADTQIKSALQPLITAGYL
jgi:RNA polymerase sigma factor (sigma-70 family)